MNLKEATHVFTALEEAKHTDVEGDPPVYDVRLDAASDRDDERTYRVRVTPSFTPWLDTDALRYLIETAEEHVDAPQFVFENNGVAIR